VQLPCPSDEGVWGSGRVAPPILKLGTRWSKWSTSFQPLYPWERSMVPTE